jgi:hypothetical protein
MKTYYLTRWEQMHGIVQMQYKVEAESEESVKDGKFEVIEAEQLALEIDDIGNDWVDEEENWVIEEKRIDGNIEKDAELLVKGDK